MKRFLPTKSTVFWKKLVSQLSHITAFKIYNYYNDNGKALRHLKQKEQSVQFSHSVVSDSLRPYELQHARPPCPSPAHGVYPNSSPWSQWCHPTISSSVSPSPPALNLSQHQSLFKWVGSWHQVAKVLEFELQHQSFQWTPRTDLL